MGKVYRPKSHPYAVGIYSYGGYDSTAEFKYKWQAFLFHVLINRSLNHNGTREY